MAPNPHKKNSLRSVKTVMKIWLSHTPPKNPRSNALPPYHYISILQQSAKQRPQRRRSDRHQASRRHLRACAGIGLRGRRAAGRAGGSTRGRGSVGGGAGSEGGFGAGGDGGGGGLRGDVLHALGGGARAVEVRVAGVPDEAGAAFLVDAAEEGVC